MSIEMLVVFLMRNAYSIAYVNPGTCSSYYLGIGLVTTVNGGTDPQHYELCGSGTHAGFNLLCPSCAAAIRL
jgi:hypothetical protein